MNAHTYYYSTTLLTLHHSYVFQSSKDHPQGVQLVYFSSKANKMNYQMHSCGSQIKHI